MVEALRAFSETSGKPRRPLVQPRHLALWPPIGLTSKSGARSDDAAHAARLPLLRSYFWMSEDRCAGLYHGSDLSSRRSKGMLTRMVRHCQHSHARGSAFVSLPLSDRCEHWSARGGRSGSAGDDPSRGQPEPQRRFLGEEVDSG
jgi:hypothetical protein